MPVLFLALLVIAVILLVGWAASSPKKTGRAPAGAPRASGVNAGGVNAGGVNAGGVNAGGVNAGGVKVAAGAHSAGAPLAAHLAREGGAGLAGLWVGEAAFAAAAGADPLLLQVEAPRGGALPAWDAQLMLGEAAEGPLTLRATAPPAYEPEAARWRAMAAVELPPGSPLAGRLPAALWVELDPWRGGLRLRTETTVYGVFHRDARLAEEAGD